MAQANKFLFTVQQYDRLGSPKEYLKYTVYAPDTVALRTRPSLLPQGEGWDEGI
jgi:hypothetical protein